MSGKLLTLVVIGGLRRVAPLNTNFGLIADVLNGNIGEVNLADLAVSSGKLQNGVVNADKLSTDAVTTVKVTDRNITARKTAGVATLAQLVKLTTDAAAVAAVESTYKPSTMKFEYTPDFDGTCHVHGSLRLSFANMVYGEQDHLAVYFKFVRETGNSDTEVICGSTIALRASDHHLYTVPISAYFPVTAGQPLRYNVSLALGAQGKADVTGNITLKADSHLVVNHYNS